MPSRHAHYIIWNFVGLACRWNVSRPRFRNGIKGESPNNPNVFADERDVYERNVEILIEGLDVQSPFPQALNRIRLKKQMEDTASQFRLI